MNNTFIVNNRFITSTHTQTTISAGSLYTINLPVYHIPFHILAALKVLSWRNSPSPSLPLGARKITYGLAMGTLAIIGIADGIIRIALSILIYPFQPSTSYSFFKSAIFGFKQSIYYATHLQIDNFTENRIVIDISV
ncbi:MAG: hypothetical protein H0V82_01005 [Candidatus Protochlamydia sp.]|nr:hypothetical protein [Candidatus Protochlamydia sp.]